MWYKLVFLLVPFHAVKQLNKFAFFFLVIPSTVGTKSGNQSK